MARLTDHAKKRAKQRLGLSEKAALRQAERALEHGLRHAECPKKLRGWMAERYRRGGGKANNMRVYGEHLFLFADDLLITVFRLPRDLVRLAHEAQEARDRARPDQDA